MNHRKVQIKPSKIHNVGLYPIEDISIGEIVMEFNWEKIKKYINISGYSKKKKMYWARLWGTQFDIIPFEQYFHPVNFLNHSDKPNIKYNSSIGCYLAIEKLTENDEILINYEGYNDFVWENLMGK